ncbi:MAG: hypothetical protein ACREVH_05470, partial [Gammaproteobacteria bacterium]
PPPRPGDFGLGDTFRFPFVTIEDAVILSPSEFLVINDNNFPFSAGRNPSRPDDNEFIRVLLDDTLDVDPEVLVRPPLLTPAGIFEQLTDTNPNYTNGKASSLVFEKVYRRPLPTGIASPSFGLGTSEFIGQDGGDVFATRHWLQFRWNAVTRGAAPRRCDCHHSGLFSTQLLRCSRL